MTLGEKISKLRNAHKLSQSDLAEKLNVSRQSISKWETNASIPELDKLIQLSDLFQITLDELVRENFTETTENIEIPNTDTKFPNLKTNISNTQKIIGFILLAVGLLSCVLSFCFVNGSLLLILGIYAIICSTLCLLLKKHVLLVIGWLSALAAFFYLKNVVGTRVAVALFTLFNPKLYASFNMANIISIIITLLFIVLVVCTIRSYLKSKNHTDTAR